MNTPGIIFETRGPKHHFFGYHDISPWDESGKFLLTHEVDFIDRRPNAEDAAGICVVDTQKNEFRRLTESRAWNFQQGARLQWVPGQPDKIVFNDRAGAEGLIAVILDVKNGQKRILEHPVYALDPRAKFALGLDFGALTERGGYGYAGSTATGTGIMRVDLERGDAKELISMDRISNLEHSPRPEERHTITHIAFNPSGTRICLAHRYWLPDGGFIQRLITAAPDGADMYVLPASHISHFCWKNDTEIFSYGKWSPGITALRQAGLSQSPLLKPFLNLARKMRGPLKQKLAGQGYLLLKDGPKEVERVAAGTMAEDGHPQFSPDGKWVVTDTYADKNHERALILFDWEKQKRIDIGKFYSLPKGAPPSWDDSEMRSDLHPRWNRDGTQICIDSVHTGSRQVHVLEVSGIVHAQN